MGLVFFPTLSPKVPREGGIIFFDFLNVVWVWLSLWTCSRPGAVRLHTPAFATPPALCGRAPNGACHKGDNLWGWLSRQVISSLQAQIAEAQRSEEAQLRDSLQRAEQKVQQKAFQVLEYEREASVHLGLLGELQPRSPAARGRLRPRPLPRVTLAPWGRGAPAAPYLSMSPLQLSELMREKRQEVEKDHERKMERMKEEQQEALARLRDQCEEEVPLGTAVGLGGDCGGAGCPGRHCRWPDLPVPAAAGAGSLLSSGRTGHCCHDGQ